MRSPEAVLVSEVLSDRIRTPRSSEGGSSEVYMSPLKLWVVSNLLKDTEME